LTNKTYSVTSGGARFWIMPVSWREHADSVRKGKTKGKRVNLWTDENTALRGTGRESLRCEKGRS